MPDDHTYAFESLRFPEFYVIASDMGGLLSLSHGSVRLERRPAGNIEHDAWFKLKPVENATQPNVYVDTIYPSQENPNGVVIGFLFSAFNV